MPAIADYGSLVGAITDYSHRANLATYTDSVIQEAQEQTERDIPAANFGDYVRFQESAYPPVAIGSDGTAPVPDDWLGPKILTCTGFVTRTLLWQSAAFIYARYPYRKPDGFPKYVARDIAPAGTSALIFGPFPHQAFTVQGTYYAKAPALSSATPTNWMTINAPGLLHAACMLQVGLFIPDDKLIARWTPLYQQRLKALCDADRAERFAAAAMQVARA